MWSRSAIVWDNGENEAKRKSSTKTYYSTMCNGSCFFCNFWNVLASKSPSCFPLGTRAARVYLLIPFTHWSKKSSTSHSLAILSWLFLSSQETLYLKISEMPEQIPDISLTQSTCLNLVWVQVEQVTLTEAKEGSVLEGLHKRRSMSLGIVLWLEQNYPTNPCTGDLVPNTIVERYWNLW